MYFVKKQNKKPQHYSLNKRLINVQTTMYMVQIKKKAITVLETAIFELQLQRVGCKDIKYTD